MLTNHAEAVTLADEVQQIEIIKVPTEREQIDNLIEQYDWDVSIARQIMFEESRYKPTAYNPEWHKDRQGNPICQGSYGLMQVACIHHMQNPKALYDITFNIELAYKIYSKSGWSPWGVCHDGKVDCS